MFDEVSATTREPSNVFEVLMTEQKQPALFAKPKTSSASGSHEKKRAAVTTTAHAKRVAAHKREQVSLRMAQAVSMSDDAAASVSSAEQERVKKRQGRRDRMAKKKPPPPMVLTPEQIQAQLPSQTSIQGVEVLTFDDMMVQFPNLGQTMGSGGNSDALELDENGVAPSEAKALQHPPPASRILKAHIERLPKPDYVRFMSHGLSASELMLQLERRVVLLPVQTAELESQLLAEGGHHTLTMQDGTKRRYAFPLCIRGPECIGMTGGIPGFSTAVPGVILTSMMWENEYRDFLHSGIAPMEQRACVLCARLHFTNFILCLRSHEFMGSITSDESFAFQTHRNLKDEAGGYFGIYINQPSPQRVRERGFFDCIAVYSRSALRAYQDPAQDHRWVIDQSLMVWEPEPVITPQVGEELSLFRARVRSSRDALLAVSVRLFEKMQSAHDPIVFLTRWVERSWTHTSVAAHSACALLKQNYQWQKPLALRTVTEAKAIRDQLQQVLTCLIPAATTLEELEVQHMVCLLLDCNESCDVPEDLERYLELRGHMQQVQLAPQVLAFTMMRHVREACFWQQYRSGHTTGLGHLLNKCVNQPCQTRKYDSMVKRYIRGSAIKRRILCNLLLTALCGHYPDIPVVDRLSLPWRRVIQVAFALQLPVLDNLVACSCGLLLFAMRSCLQWWVQDDAALRQHCYLLFKWQGFEEVVKQTWRAIRQAINAVTPPTLHHLLTESTSLFPVEMMSQINTICDEAHAAVLLTSYKRQRDSITKVIHTCKQVNGSLEFAASDNEDSDNEPKEEDEEQDSSSSTALRVLSPSLLEAIYDWVRCYDPRRITLEQAIFPSMRLLEVHPVAEADMNDLVEEYNEWRLGKRALRARILQFCKKFPYTFAVYQAVCSLWANHACFHMYELPSHYRKYQIQALVEKYLPHVMTKADVLRLPVLLDKIHMLHCVACGCIYTITRVPHSMHRKSRQIHIQQQTRLAFLTRELEHQLQDTSTSEMICGVMGTSLQQEEQARGLHGYAEGARQLLCLDGTQIGFPMTGAGVAPWSIHKGGQFSGYNYIYGYTDCTLDFFTGQVHCKYDRREGHLRCSAQPLKRCSLLGNLVCYRGLITLCPQEGCGLPFLYSAMECVYTERGFACAACSNRILEERWQERIQMWNLPYDLETGHFTSRATCSVCGVTFSQRRTCYLYPHGILLCEYHHTRRTQAYLAKAELLTKEEAHQVLQVASKKIWTKDGYRQGRRKQTTVGTGRKFYTK